MKNSKTGFSLVEIVIAIVLVAIAAVASLSFLVHCNRLALQPDARITAAYFCRETAELLYKQSYDGLNATTLYPLPTGGAWGKLRDQHNGTRTYTVTEMPDSTNPVYKLITVTVAWDR